MIEGVHASMLEAGADVVETDSFQGSRLKLEEWGLGEHTLEINTKAAEIARKAAGEECFVAGSIGPTGFLPASTDPTLGDISFAKLVEVFTEQATGLVEGGADLIIIETAQDILEVKAAIFGAREAFAATGRRLPLQISVSLLPNGGKMRPASATSRATPTATSWWSSTPPIPSARSSASPSRASPSTTASASLTSTARWPAENATSSPCRGSRSGPR